MALSCIFTKRNEAGTYFVRGNKRLEDTVEFRRAHTLLILTIIPNNIGKDRVRLVNIVHQIFKFIRRSLNEVKHLSSITISLFRAREVFLKFLFDLLKAFAQLS